jgi:hypothetical protein
MLHYCCWADGRECGENMEVWKKRRKEMESLGFMGEMSFAQGERIK